MSKSNNKCITKFLSDEPASVDEFESHKKVGYAIAEAIDKQEKAGKAVALLGSWGSGKSTIIRLIEDEFKVNKDTRKYSHINCIFQFDAWTHQGDPLRFTFLETINKFLRDIGWIKDESWSKKLDELKVKVEKSYVDEKFDLSNWEASFILSIFLFPLGIALSSKYINLRFLFNNLSLSYFTNNFLSFDVIVLLASALLIVFPFIVLLLSYICGESVIAVLLNKIRVIRNSVIVKSLEPTSVQFQKYFSELMGSILVDKKRLTIVLDNLDRIDRQEALSLWDTMRTFMEFSDKENQKWLDNFWLIVPMDNRAASRLWGLNDKENLTKREGQKGKDTPREPERQQIREDDIAKAFIDKTFQVVFRVSPPVPSDWKKYFKKYLYEATKHNEGDLDEVYRLFQLKYSFRHEIVTPREIKLFINKLAAVHCQSCSDGISLASQALFTLFVDDITDIVDNINDKNFFGGKIWELYVEEKPDTLKEFVALYLNAPKEKAIQILIEPRVDASFESAEPSELQDIAGQDWFEDVCESVVSDRSSGWNWDKIANTAYVIEKVRNNRDFNYAFSRLTSSLTKAKQISELNVTNAEGFSIILNRSGNKRQPLEENAIESVANMVFKAENDGQQPNMAVLEKWVKGVIVLLGSISEKDRIADSLRVPGRTPGTYLNILEILCNEGDEGKALLKYSLPKNLSDSDIFNAIGTVIDSRALSEKELKYIETMLDTTAFDAWNWSPLVESLFGLFQAPSNKVLEPKEVITGLTLLNRLAKKGRAINALSNVEDRFSGLAKHGHIFWHLKNLLKNKGSDFDYGLRTIGACLVPIVKYAENKTAIRPDMIEYWREGYDKYRRIIETFDDKPDNRKVLEYFTDYTLDFYSINELIEKINNIPSPIVRLSLEYINEKENRLDYYTPEILVKIYKSDTSNNFKTLFKEDSKRSLVGSLVSNTDLINVLQKTTDFSTDLVELYMLALETEKGSSDEEYKRFLAENLSLRGKDEWVALLVSETGTGKTSLDLLQALVERNTRPDSTSNLFNALEEYVNSIISGSVTPNEKQIKRNIKVPSALQDSDRNVFVRHLSERIRDKAKADENYSIEILFKLYGEMLLCKTVFADDNSEFVRVVFKHILNRKSSVEVDWLDKAVDFLIGNRAKRNIRDLLITYTGQIASRLSEPSIDPAFKEKLGKIYEKLKERYGRRKPKQ